MSTDNNSENQMFQNVSPAEQPKKNLLSRFFNSKAASFVTGIVVAAGVKTAVCALLASTSPIALLGAAAAAGAVKGTIAHMRQRSEAHADNKDMPGWNQGLKTIAKHATISAAGAVAFGALDHIVDLGICEKISDYFNTPANVTMMAVPLAPEDVPVTEVPEVTVTAPTEPALADAPQHLSAQELKDRGYCKFNGFCGLDKDQVGAVEDFKAADAMGNNGAGIDLAYSEYWGKGGLEMNKEQGIEKMKDVLEKMRGEGLEGTAEYDRGEDLLEKWLGTEDHAFEEADPDEAALNDSREEAQKELDALHAEEAHEAETTESKEEEVPAAVIIQEQAIEPEKPEVHELTEEENKALQLPLQEQQQPEVHELTEEENKTLQEPVQEKDISPSPMDEAPAVEESAEAEENSFSLRKCDHISMTFDAMGRTTFTCTIDNVKDALSVPESGNAVINPLPGMIPFMTAP